jgi:dTDP-4-dehydrorhamnose 3,5-epimerase
MENRFKKLEIEDVLIFKPKKFKDERGYFFENFNYIDFRNFSSFSFNIIQENISFSNKNVIRGMHFQRGKFAQSKLISVVKGQILDVIVDIRLNSKTFGKWITYYLDDKINESIFVPTGFAHGFLSLAKETIVSYKVDKHYSKDNECSLLWNDKTVNIKWPIKDPIISDKDKQGMTMKELIKLKIL